MKNSCDMIRDLLPLYVDGVCSESSKKTVEDHLLECEECSHLYTQLKDHHYEDTLITERNTVVSHHNKTMKRTAYTVGVSVAAVLMIPVLVTFIVNLATGRTLDWFFIVLTSLFVVISLSVVPLLKQENKLLWTIGTFTMSLLVLLLTITIFTGGSWFLIAALPIVAFILICFLPYILYKCPQKGLLKYAKGLICMGVNSLMIYTIVVTALIYAQATIYMGSALLTVSLSLILPWIIFIIIRYVKINGFLRAGFCVLIGSVYNLFFNSWIGRIWNHETGVRFTYVDFTNWSDNLVLNANIDAIIFMSLVFIAVVLLVIGTIRRKAVL